MTSITGKFIKINVTTALAGLVTFSLFFIMQLLISSNKEITVTESFPPIGDITIPPIKIEVNIKDPRPIKPDDIIEPPEITDIDFKEKGPAIFQPPITPVTIDPFKQGGPLGLADTNALAIVQFPPTYPSRPLDRGTEGFVVLEFNVDEQGSVVDPQILLSQPPGVFDRSALKAIQRWKYNPKIVDGNAVKMFGVQQKMIFTIKE